MTPGFLIKHRRLKLGLSRKQLAEGLLSVQSLAAYEAGWHVPIAEKWDGLCERLQLDKDEFIVVVTSHRELLKRAYTANRKRDWATAQPLWAELARREHC